MSSETEQVYKSGYTFRNPRGHLIQGHTWPVDSPRASIFLIHGLADYSDRYNHIAEFLNEAGIFVFSHDAQGHGQSEGNRCMFDSILQPMEDVFQSIEIAFEQHPVLKEKPLFFYGHSMGGLISVYAVIEERPNKPKNLAGLISTGPALMPNPAMATPLKIALCKFVAWIAPNYHVGDVSSEWLTRDLVEREKTDNNPLVYHRGLKAGMGAMFLRDMPGAQERASEFKLPLLILHGGDDHLALVEGSKKFIENCGSSDKELIIFPGAYHQLFLELPEERKKALEAARDFILKRS